MNYLIITGSPHKGNTWKLAELVKYELQALCNTANFDEINLTDLKYDNTIPLPFYKKMFGTVFFVIGKLAGKFVTITYRK